MFYKSCVLTFLISWQIVLDGVVGGGESHVHTGGDHLADAGVQQVVDLVSADFLGVLDHVPGAIMDGGYNLGIRMGWKGEMSVSIL